MNNTSLIRLQVRVQQAWYDLRDSEYGQAMIEYAGIALIVALLVAAVAGAMTTDRGSGIADTIVQKVQDAFAQVVGCGARQNFWSGPHKPIYALCATHRQTKRTRLRLQQTSETNITCCVLCASLLTG